MKLNLGCGDKHLDGFLNIDMSPNSKADVRADVSNLGHIVKLFSIEEIVAYDVIEHLDRTQIVPTLRHWYDHLAPGGRLLIRTNDLDRMIALYFRFPEDFPAEKLIWHLMCEHETPGMGHKWCFTKETLARDLHAAGFDRVVITGDDDLTHCRYPYANADRDYCNTHMVATK
jgi:predicted SAM-dependent methyltransferase